MRREEYMGKQVMVTDVLGREGKTEGEVNGQHQI